MKSPGKETSLFGDSASRQPKATPYDHLKPCEVTEPVRLIGQGEIVRKIDQLIAKARDAGKPFPHTLLIGDNDEAKRAVAYYLAYKMGTKIKGVSAPIIPRAGDLIGILTHLGEGDVFLIEDIKRLSKVVLEFLYTAMEQFQVDFVIDTGPYAKTIKFNLKGFTLIATSSDKNGLDAKLSNLFLCVYKPDVYSRAEVLPVFAKELRSANITCDDGVLEGIVEKYADDTGAALRALRKIVRYLELTQRNQLTKSIIAECLGVTEYNADRQAIINRTRDRYIADEVRHEVWRRDEGKCTKCGSREKLEFDHVVPLSKGGSSTARNVSLLCETCNRKKSDTL